MRKGILLLGLLAGLFLAGTALAGTIKEYTAEMVDVDSGQVGQKIYVTEQKMRADQAAGPGKPAAITIIRLDKGAIFVLQPDKTFFTIPVGGNVKNLKDLDSLMLMGMKSDVKREKEGTETISGYQADKFKVTTVLTTGPNQNITRVHYEWTAPEFDMPLRVQALGGKSAVEMRNIKVGSPAAAVFEIPDGYKRNTQLEEMMSKKGN